MREATQEEHDAIMNSMKEFADGGVPCVGIFWLDIKEMKFFGVNKMELTPKMLEEAEEDGVPFVTYPKLHRQIWAKEYYRAHVKGLETKFEGDYTNVPRGRIAWDINKFVVFVGHWAKEIEEQLREMIEAEFYLPDFEFIYDKHWDLGHGWSGDMK